LVTKKTRAKVTKHPGVKVRRKLTHPKLAAHHTGQRHLSAAARNKISQSLKGKHHPHRGHHLSNATRAKIGAKLHARLKGRPHPHRGHHMSNQARQKISRALKGKHHTRHTTRRKKR
jgi:hypothetical protein